MNVPSFLLGSGEFPAWLVRLLFSATVLWLAAGIVVWLLRRSSAAVRHRAWGLSALAALAIPWLVMCLPQLRLGWLEASGDAAPQIPRAAMTQQPAAAMEPRESSAVSLAVRDVAALERPAANETPIPFDAPARESESAQRIAAETPPDHGTISSAGAGRHSSAGWLVALLVPAAIGLWRIARGLAATRRIVLEARDVSDAKCRELLNEMGARLAVVHGSQSGCPVSLRESNRTPVPLCAGWRKPCIVLPHDWTAWPAQTLRAVLAHELSHIARRDVAWQLVARLACAVYWFHPLAWLAAWRMRVERETACDDAVLQLGEQPAAYARALVTVAERLSQRFAIPATAVAMAARSGLEQRVRAILAANRSRLPVGRTAGRVLGLATLAIVAVAGALSPFSRENNATQVAAADSQPASETASVDRESSPGIVVGQVIRADNGSPVAGATVLLRDRQRFLATTDAEGRFRFERTPHGQYLIWAHKDDLASSKERLASREVANSQEGKFPSIRLTMKPGKQVAFTVKSAVTGKLLEGAVVRFGYPDRRRVTTDKEGKTAVKGLLPEQYQIEVEAPGHAREIREIDLTESQPVVSFTYALAAGGVIQGTVVDENQKPRANVSVTYRVPGISWGFHGTAFRTDEQGRFSNLHLPLNSPVKVWVGVDGHLPQEIELTLTPQQPQQQVAIQLKRRPRGGSVAGVVVDWEGKPVAGATVGSYGNGSEKARETTTDEQGRFVLHDLLKDSTGHEIVVRARKFAPKLQTVEPGPENAPPNVSVSLDVGHSIVGRLVDQAGKPVKGGYIMVNRMRYPQKLQDFGRTDEQGRFEFDSLPPESMFYFGATGYSSFDDAPLALDGNDVVVVKLEPMGVIRGIVVDSATGKPLDKFRVRLGFSDDRRPGDASGSYNSTYSEPGVTVQSKEGAFLLTDLVNRMPLEVTVEAEDYERTVLPRVVAHTADAKDAVKITLRPRTPGQSATVSGKIVDHKVRPVAGAQLRLIVTAEPSNGEDDNRFNWVLIDSDELRRKTYVEQYLTTVTDAQGRFEFKDVLTGKFLQLAYWGDKAPKSRSLALRKTVAGAGQSVVIRVPEPAVVRGSFDPALFRGAGSITLMRLDDAWHRLETELKDGQTKFEFDVVPPGKYQAAIYARAERDKKDPRFTVHRPLAGRKLTIEPGKTYTIDFTEADCEKTR